MADKSIADLPVLQAVDDTTQIPVWQPGATNPAQKLAGSKFREFSEQAAEQYIEDATQVVQRAEQALDSLGDDAARAKQSADNAAESERKAKLYADQTESSVSGVASFNGRGGHVMPQAGDYTADMVGAAPAGFGLGEPVPPQIELADIYKSGFYRCWLQKSNGDPANGWHTLHAIVNGHYNNVQLSGAASSGYVRRNKWNGVWDPWEWVNPPMEIGVEYRTTERYCGDPVYTQVMNLGYIGKGPHAIEHGIHVKEAIGLTVINSGYGDFTHITSVDPSFTPTVININPSEWAMGNTKVILRYTKT